MGMGCNAAILYGLHFSSRLDVSITMTHPVHNNVFIFDRSIGRSWDNWAQCKNAQGQYCAENVPCSTALLGEVQPKTN